MKSLVNQMVADSERDQKERIKAELVSLQSTLQTTHSADLAKVISRIQEQQTRLKTIERDIDRREGLDLTDILFSEVNKPAERSTAGGDCHAAERLPPGPIDPLYVPERLAAFRPYTEPRGYSLSCGLALLIFFASFKPGPDTRRSGNSTKVWRVNRYLSDLPAFAGLLNDASS